MNHDDDLRPINRRVGLKPTEIDTGHGIIENQVVLSAPQYEIRISPKDGTPSLWVLEGNRWRNLPANVRRMSASLVYQDDPDGADRAILAEREACAQVAEKMLRFADTTSSADVAIAAALLTALIAKETP